MHFKDDKPLYRETDSGDDFKFGLWFGAIVLAFAAAIVLVILGLI